MDGSCRVNTFNLFSAQAKFFGDDGKDEVCGVFGQMTVLADPAAKALSADAACAYGDQ